MVVTIAPIETEELTPVHEDQDGIEQYSDDWAIDWSKYNYTDEQR